MGKKEYDVMLLLSLVAGLVACAVGNGPPQPDEAKMDDKRIERPTARRNVGLRKPLPVHLAIGTFDPLSEAGPIELPAELTMKSYPEGESGYYILQFKGPVLEKWKEALVSAGASIFDYIPQFAFLVKMDHQAVGVVQAMDPVRWIGIYQPGYRIAPDLMAIRSKKTDQPIELIISVFRGENVLALTSEMERLGGEILEVSKGEEKIKLKIPAYRIADLSRLSGIRYVEGVPKFKLFPRNSIKGRVE
jgi:hypothetical protein